jgi:hypothetical protein
LVLIHHLSHTFSISLKQLTVAEFKHSIHTSSFFHSLKETITSKMTKKETERKPRDGATWIVKRG